MIGSAGVVSWGRACGWGVFLACSWTWCIGLWLPVFLAREFGWPGWVAFILPNAAGAAAMGLVLTRESSMSLVVRHAGAMRAFSVITILFHASFLTWWLAWIASAASAVGRGWIGGLTGWFVVAAGLMSARGGGWIGRAVAVYVVSLLAWAATWCAGAMLTLPPAEGKYPVAALALAWPVMVFGFALSPYLDATFHRVRQACAGPTGAAAFVLGFGVFFLLLMVYSLLYAGGVPAGAVSWWLVVHVAVQSWFTIAAHAREVLGGGLTDEPATHRRRAMIVVGLTMLTACGAALPWLPDPRPGIPATRLAYDLFLSAYALPFPAYVWIVMIERGVALRTRLFAWVAACVLAAPFLWLGFVERRFEWIPVAVGIPLIAPVVVKPLVKRSRC